VHNFVQHFCFTIEDPAQKEVLLWIKYFIFHRQLKDATPKVVCSYHQLVAKLKEVVHCWKIEVDDVDDNDPRGIQIKESKGQCVVKGKVKFMIVLDYGCLIKTKKHNIVIEGAPKMAIIGGYWDKDTVT
jgi:hypothetical protein